MKAAEEAAETQPEIEYVDEAVEAGAPEAEVPEIVEIEEE